MERSESVENVLEVIRMKYADDLEDILECPVCYEISKGIIAMCVKGHHICISCKDILVARREKCPTCQNSFSNCRNYAVEKLSSKFEDIRSSILDPRHASNKRIIKNVASVLVQTDKHDMKGITTKIMCTVETQTNDGCVYKSQISG